MGNGILSRFDTFLFDLDGVILDSVYYWRHSTIEYLDSIGQYVPDEVRKDVLKYPGGTVFNWIKEKYDPDFDMYSSGMAVGERMKYHYRYDISPKEHVREALTELAAENKRVCIATATPERYCFPALERLGLDKLIERVFDAEVAGCSKGDPAFFMRLSDQLNINLNKSVFFDDSLTNLISAKEAGLFTCGVEEKLQEQYHEDIIKTADIFISDFKVLINLL